MSLGIWTRRTKIIAGSRAPIDVTAGCQSRRPVRSRRWCRDQNIKTVPTDDYDQVDGLLVGKWKNFTEPLDDVATSTVVLLDMEGAADGTSYTDSTRCWTKNGRWKVIAKVFHQYEPGHRSQGVRVPLGHADSFDSHESSASPSTKHRGPLGVLAGNMDRDEPELAAIIEAEQNQAEAASLRTIGELVAAPGNLRRPQPRVRIGPAQRAERRVHQRALGRKPRPCCPADRPSSALPATYADIGWKNRRPLVGGEAGQGSSDVIA
jgi:hypothetical protein